MTDPSFVLLYVDDPVRSAAFYERLLGKKPVDLAPTFALFVLASGWKLGLWRRGDVQPPAFAMGGGAELCFPVPDAAAVDAAHVAWHAQGVAIAQAPVKMDFGYTFTGLDPDVHRLRVFHPAG
jgi:catechol 2,3-dioxygenase-like lactoylglutathione lyase family enzyme